MGLAIDSVALNYTTSTSAPSAFEAMTVASGDSLTVRNFLAPSTAFLYQMLYSASTKDSFRVRSPLMHDDVRGIQFEPGESPTQFLMPLEVGQRLYAQDTLVAEVDAQTASATHAVVLNIYYTNLNGAAARLHNWGDIAALIVDLKPLEVACTGSANSWVDTVITTTEDLLKANTDYAVLGIASSLACCGLALKGPDTSNLRIAAPSVARTIETADYFIDLSNRFKQPMIPVINAANKNATYVSIFSDTAVSPKVQLLLAELSQNLPD